MHVPEVAKGGEVGEHEGEAVAVGADAEAEEVAVGEYCSEKKVTLRGSTFK
jgi:hypothetical protein